MIATLKPNSTLTLPPSGNSKPKKYNIYLSIIKKIRHIQY